jgi:Membrane proteins related to metalloendopeptidases
MKVRRRVVRRTLLGVGLAVALAGFLWPQRAIIPVRGAAPRDWNPESFWYSPWGPSGVHKGIDIFADEGTSVRSATPGLVLIAGNLALGGNVVAVLGPKWRIHYYAHLDEIRTSLGRVVASGEEIGSVGTTGNAAGKPPHLHYAIVTAVPYPWRVRLARHGWKRMFYLDPGEAIALSAGASSTSAAARRRP